eukprot:758311-Hanusia_phi.AAC.6
MEVTENAATVGPPGAAPGRAIQGPDWQPARAALPGGTGAGRRACQPRRERDGDSVSELSIILGCRDRPGTPGRAAGHRAGARAAAAGSGTGMTGL